jgi:serine/threonine protein kinase
VNPKKINEYLKSISDNRFKIIQIYGEGTYGISLKVKNVTLKRFENIKILKLDSLISISQFKKEARILANLHHNNIPTIYDINTYNDKLVLRTKNIDGISLRTLINYFKKNNKVMDLNKSIKIYKDILNCLKYIHSKKIFHFDIKPENIIISIKNKLFENESEAINSFLKSSWFDIKASLIDFGLAQIFSKNKELIFGDASDFNYSSPEQIRNEKIISLNDSVDRYALSSIFYELLSNEKPFKNIDQDNLKKSLEIKKEQPKSPKIINNKTKNLEKNIHKFILKELSYKKEDRYESDSKAEKEIKKIITINEIKKTSKAIFFCILICLITLLIYNSIIFLRSVDGIILRKEIFNIDIEQNPSFAYKLNTQIANKYLESYKKGNFETPDGSIGFPTYTDLSGNWIFVEPDNERSGEFIGLLWELSDYNPKIKEIAIIYTEKLLSYDSDSLMMNQQFFDALIPAYEKTNSSEYIIVLENKANNIIKILEESRIGLVGTDDLVWIRSFLWLYKNTNNKTYLEYAESKLNEFIINNIDNDYYVYDYSYFNASRIINGQKIPIENMKITTSTITDKELKIGGFVIINQYNESIKNRTSIFTKDYLRLIDNLIELSKITNNKNYETLAKNLFDKYINSHYLNHNKIFSFSNLPDNIDKIHIDSFSYVKTMKLLNKFENLKIENSDYKNIKNKMINSLLTKENIQKNNENGIVKNTFIGYFANENIYNRISIETDTELVKIMKKI